MSNQPASKQSEPRQKKGARTALLVVLAAVIVGALIVQATLSPLDLSGDDDKRHGSHEQLYGDASTPTDALWAAVPAASMDVQTSLEDVQARVTLLLEDETFAAQAQVRSTLASLQSVIDLYAGLPPVPVGYVAGLPIDGVASQVTGYVVPTLETTLALDTFTTPIWSAVPSAIPVHPGIVPGVQADAIDDVLQQVLAVLAELQEMEELGEILATLESVAGGTPLGGLPLDGLGGPDVEGTVSPHEEGALVAFSHAEALLGTAGGAFGDLIGEAESILASQGDLVAHVQSTIASTQQTVLSAEQAILDEALARTDKTLADVTKLQQQLQAALDTYLQNIEKMVADIHLALEDIQADVEAGIEAGVGRQVRNLEAMVGSVQGDLDIQVRAVVQEGRRIIGALESQGASLSEIEAVLQAMDDVRGQLEARAAASLELIQSTIDDVHIQADDALALVERQVSRASLTADNLVRGVVPEAQARLDYAIGLALANADATIEAHKALALQTIGGLQARATFEAEQLIDTSLASVEQLRGSLVRGIGLVGEVQTEVFDEVGTDLSYILKVAEDYAAAPTPERQERADHWLAVHGTVDGTLGTVLSTGQGAESVVAQALSLSEANLAGLLAMS